MDKNTLVGFLLIIGIFIGFFWISQPSAEQLEQRKRYNDSIILVQKEQSKLAEIEAIQQENVSTTVDNVPLDSVVDVNNAFGPFAKFTQGSNELLVLENKKLKIGVDTKGGVIQTVELKEYLTHDKQTLQLMDGSSEKTNFTFVTANNRIVNSEDLYFQPIWTNHGQSLIMRLAFDSISYIDFEYALKEDDYIVSFKITP
ncbi:MAG TPA: YidC/Oxa1 family insertase periplasmic-domain containing protein, partial [Paludibacteraceae bacterium]|nr:YidC/Oxa1 family insertase periplasmic-domain containing protein [Paludibacteraceae bacterium]